MAIRESIGRLLTCLCQPDDMAVVGASLIHDVLYRALQGTHAGAQRSAKQDVAKRRSFEPMAADAGMSSAVFHRAFQDAAGSSPLQYNKKLRPTKARSPIVHDSMRANDAAFQLGYESASQFSGAFKACSGVTAAQARESAYVFIRSPFSSQTQEGTGADRSRIGLPDH